MLIFNLKIQLALESVFEGTVKESELTSYLGLVYETKKEKLIFVKTKSKKGVNLFFLIILVINFI